MPKALQSREQGAGITDVGQVFQRSGTLQVSFKDKNITTAADLDGKKVGNWGFGNEFELFAGHDQGRASTRARTSTLVQQQFDMQALLKGDIDAAQAMIYNEYAQVLEAKNPDTGELYTPDDFNRIDWNEEGTAMLQDAIWANTEKLESDKAYQDQTVEVPRGELQGLDLLPGQRRGVPRHRGRERLQARRQPPAVADERDQQAHLALARRHRHGGPGRLGPDGEDRPGDARTRTATRCSPRRPEGLAYTNDYAEKALAALKEDGADVTGDELRADRGAAQGGRRLSTAPAGPAPSGAGPAGGARLSARSSRAGRG